MSQHELNDAWHEHVGRADDALTTDLADIALRGDSDTWRQWAKAQLAQRN